MNGSSIPGAAVGGWTVGGSNPDLEPSSSFEYAAIGDHRPAVVQFPPDDIDLVSTLRTVFRLPQLARLGMKCHAMAFRMPKARAQISWDFTFLSYETPVVFVQPLGMVLKVVLHETDRLTNSVSFW